MTRHIFTLFYFLIAFVVARKRRRNKTVRSLVETSDVEWPFPDECSLPFLPIQEILIEKLATRI